MIKLEELSYNGKVVLTIGFDDKDQTVVLVDENRNTVRLGREGIALTSEKNIEIKAGGSIKMSGLNIDLNANVSLNAKGTASAELSASGQTVVKGAMVMIN